MAVLPIHVYELVTKSGVHQATVPHPTGQKHRLDAARDGSAYSTAHALYHPWLRQYLEQRGYYDIFLISMNGDIVYTVFKEPDFATNLNSGAWKDTGLFGAVTDLKDQAELLQHEVMKFLAEIRSAALLQHRSALKMAAERLGDASTDLKAALMELQSSVSAARSMPSSRTL